MTGYGKAVTTYNGKKICVEIKSLNSKALDLSARIAPLYREKEMEIRQLIAQSLERGKIDFCLYIEKDACNDATPLNAALAEKYYHEMQAFVSRMGLAEPQDWLSFLVRMPDVMAKNDVEELGEDEWNEVRNTVMTAINNLQDFRKQEGAALQRKFEEKIDNIEKLMAEIEPYEKLRVEKIRSRIVEGLNSIPNVEYDKNRLEQELIYDIEKLDISEEKQRLANHLNYFRQTMNEGHGQGKKLGFIAQEMGREINTTGSKSNQAEMQNIVVKMKDELEQIKEQVLNAL